MRNRRKAIGDIRLDHPPAAPPALVNEHLQGIVRRPSRAEPKLTGRNPASRPARARSSPRPARSGPGPGESKAAAARPHTPLPDETPRGQRTIPAFFHAAPARRAAGRRRTLDRGQDDLVNAGAPLLLRTRPTPAAERPFGRPCIQRMDLARDQPWPPVKHMLQARTGSAGTPARSLRGGTSHLGTHRAPP